MDLLLLVLEQLLEFVIVFVNGVGKTGEIVRQHVGVCKAQHHGTDGLGESATIDEVFVGKMGKPVKVVVNRVIDAAIVLAAKTNVKRGDAAMVNEGRVVAAG